MPERIKPDEASYQTIKSYTPDELKKYLKDNSKLVSDDLFKIEDLIEGVRRRRQLIAIAEKELDSKTTRVSNPPIVTVNFNAGVASLPSGLDLKRVDDNLDEVTQAVASTRTGFSSSGTISVAGKIVGSIEPGSFELHTPEELTTRTPLPVTEAQDKGVNYGGRVPESVLSRDQWLKLMESREGARDVALYHDRSESGMIRTRTRALTGEFPESKFRTEIFQMLYDGFTIDEVATEFKRDPSWVQNVSNYLSAVLKRQKDGLPTPTLGLVVA